ncbi:MAG: exodeoxyribonuclease VII small subunit [Methylocystis sp.]|jgi:exodeoxyribonuclease VII small subunit
MTTEKEAAEDLSTVPFEKAMAEFERIVADLEKGSVSLDESVRLYARGKALQERCEKLLAEAEARVEKITLGENGAPKGAAPLDVE